jgi:hypothetical protein
MTSAEHTFVVVTEDAALEAAVRTAVGELARVYGAKDLASALALVRRPGTLGAIVDGNATAVKPVQQLARLRAAAPLVSILFVAGELRSSLLNDIQPLRVELVARPLPTQAIERFIRRSSSAGRLSDVHVGAWIEHLANAHKLNGTDLALFPLVLDRETPEALCLRLNIDRAALSRGLRRLVKKCRVRNTDRLAKNLMRDALLLGAGGAPQSMLSEAASA